VFESAVVGLDRVVGVLLDAVPGGRDQFVEHRGVDRGAVGDDLDGLDLQCGQRLVEEPAGRGGVTAGREQHVDYHRAVSPYGCAVTAVDKAPS
jgi:hypothetical protein